MKIGTPIGRLVDEAGDSLQYSMVAMIMGHVMRLPPGMLNLSYGLLNLPQYSMEIKYLMTGELIMKGAGAAENIGPVEIEVLMAFIFSMAGIFGTTGLQKPVSSYLGGALSGLIPEAVHWNHLLASIYIILILLFTVDNIKDCLAKN